jgi:DNA-binding FrmR family transcriptional regulator
MPPVEPSHGDILERLGELKGQVAALTAMVAQKQEDLRTAFNLIRALEQGGATREEVQRIDMRIRGLEAQTARWAGVLLAATFMVPIVVPIAKEFIRNDLHAPSAAVESIR